MPSGRSAFRAAFPASTSLVIAVLVVACSSAAPAASEIEAQQTTTARPTPTTIRRVPIEVVVTTTPVTIPAVDPTGMPDVVCMNLQEAQDLIQEVTGVFFSRSTDASGEGRRQIRDRNWIVVSQEPAPGTSIGEGDAVLSVVKTDEPNDC